MEQNFQDIYEQLQSRIRQAEDKRLQLKAKGTKNGLIAGGITLSQELSSAWLSEGDGRVSL